MDLRERILDATVTLIEAEGLAALSMREVARRAGVSHQAPYHHFTDRQAILAAIAFFLFGFFSYEIFYVLRQVPRSAQAPEVGERARNFSLPDQNGTQIALGDLLSPNGVVLIFYRGHW